MMPHILHNQVAVVTGSTRGIGLAIATAFLNAGAKVVLTSRSQAGLDQGCQQLAEIDSDRILGITCDVCDRTQVEHLANQAIAQWGQLNIWVNNAGITGPYGATADIPPDQWQAVIQTHLLGTYYGTRTALTHMLKPNQGKIINLFGAGDQDSMVDKYEYMSAYATAKAAVRRFTLVTAAEYRHTNLSILGLRPGLVATDLMTGIEPLDPSAAQRLQGLDLALKYFTTPIPKIQSTVVKMAAPDNRNTGKIYQCRAGLPTLLGRLWTQQ